MLLIVAGVAGCKGGTDQTPQDDTAKARLDRQLVRVNMPITPYRISPEIWRKVRIAETIASRDCMTARGFDVVIPDLASTEEDRIWGLWSVERAERYGFGHPGDEFRIEPTASYLSAEQECSGASAAALADVLGADALSLVEAAGNRIVMQGHDAALKTAAYQDLRGAYDSCLRAAGREPDSDPAHWGIKPNPRTARQGPGPASAAEIQAAVTEAACNEQLDVTQQMGDLEASFQAPLIVKDQAVLNVNKTKIADLDARLDEFLRTHQ